MASWTINGTTTSSTYWKARAVVTEQSQNIANNTTSLKVSFQLGRDVVSSYLYSYNTNWYINVGSSGSGTQTLSTWNWDPATAGTWKEIASRTITVTHDADGTKKNLSISCKWYNTGVTPSSATVSGNVTLTTIPRATTPETPINVTMGSNATITLPRASSSFTHNLTYTFGNSSGTVATGAGASATWSVPLSLANQVPSGTSGTGTITCKTYSGSTLVGTKSVSFKASVPSSVVPTISNISLSEANTTVANNFSVYVQTKSKLKVEFSCAGAYSSKVASYSVKIGSLSYSGNIGSTSATKSITSDFLPKSGSITVTIKITDTRGRTATETRSITVVSYSPPTATLSGRRATSSGTSSRTGTYLQYDYSYTISSVSSQNSKSFSIQYKRVSDSSWTTLTSGSSSYSANVTNALSSSGILDVDYSYDFRIRVTDKFSTVTIDASTISTAYTLVDYHSSGRGIAFGKVAEDTNLFDVNIPMQLRQQVVSIRPRGFQIASDTLDTNTQFYAERTDTGTAVWLGIGTGGEQHGVYSNVLNGWMIVANANGIYVNGNIMPAPQFLGGTTTAEKAQVITASSGVTITEAYFASWGRMAQLRIFWTYNSAITVPASGNINPDITVGTLVSGLSPLLNHGAWSHGNQAGAAWYGVSSGGNVSLYACEGTGSQRTISAGTEFRLYTTYILA